MDDTRVEAHVLSERLRQTLFVFGVGVLPIWFLATVTLAMVLPESQDQLVVTLDAAGEVVVSRSSSARYLLAGRLVAFWMAVLAVAVTAIALGWTRLERRRRSAQISPADLLGADLVRDAAWQVEVRHDGATAPAGAVPRPVQDGAAEAASVDGSPPAEAAAPSEDSGVTEPDEEPLQDGDDIDELFR